MKNFWIKLKIAFSVLTSKNIIAFIKRGRYASGIIQIAEQNEDIALAFVRYVLDKMDKGCLERFGKGIKKIIAEEDEYQAKEKEAALKCMGAALDAMEDLKKQLQEKLEETLEQEEELNESLDKIDCETKDGKEENERSDK